MSRFAPRKGRFVAAIWQALPGTGRLPPMDLKSLLSPVGDPYRLIPWMLAVSLLGGSGQLVIALQFGDYLWAFNQVEIGRAHV